MSEVDYNIDFTIQDLIDLKAHFGCKVSALNPKMRDNVFGIKDGISIIDIRKTYSSAIRAINLCYKFGKANKKVLFVGTSPQISPIVKECAEKCNQFYTTDRWLGGILTNWYTVSKSIKTLFSYDKILSNTESSNLSKKEILTMTKNRDKLMASFGGLVNLRGRPDLVIVFNTKTDYLAIKEALSIGIPTIAILDTNSNITGVSHTIIANDSNVKVTKFFCEQFAKAIIKGSQENIVSGGVNMSSLLKEKKETENNKEEAKKESDVEKVAKKSEKKEKSNKKKDKKGEK